MSLNSYRVYQNSRHSKRRCFGCPFTNVSLFCLERHLICPFTKVSFVSKGASSATLLWLSLCSSLFLGPFPLIKPRVFPTDRTQRPSPHKALEPPLIPHCLPNLYFIHFCSVLPALCTWSNSLHLLMKIFLLGNSWYIKYHIEIISQNH